MLGCIFSTVQTYTVVKFRSGGLFMDYKKEIIEMINGIKKTGTLEYLHTFIKLFLERWGN